MKSLKDIFAQSHRLIRAAGPGPRAFEISTIMHKYRNNIIAHMRPGENPLQLPESEVARKFPREIYAAK